MTDCLTQLRSSSATDGALRQLIEQALGHAVGDIHRRPCAYQTSFALEELTIECDGDGPMQLIFKDIGWQSLHESARWTRPAFIFDDRREIEVYSQVLARHDLGTAKFIASAVDSASSRYWLLMEDVRGIELYQTDDLALWQAAARWLRRTHATIELSTLHDLPLLRYDAKLYRTWMNRAAEFVAHAHASRPTVAPRVHHIAAQYDRVIERLTAMPQQFIHGECYASNVIVDASANPARVCPVDWELAAIGPGLLDLAALVAGRWNDSQRAAIASAYDDELDEMDLIACRLHLAVQWLGWSREWSPPPQHAHEWLSDALTLADRLEL
jgi:thiamine kinase-like enzyme